MQQRHTRQVFWGFELLGQIGMTDRQQPFTGQKFVHQLFIAMIGKADGDIDLVEVNRCQIIVIGAQLDLKIGIFHLKPPEPRHDPAHGKCQRCRNRQVGVISTVFDLGNRVFDGVKSWRKRFKKVATGARQPQASVVAFKQLATQNFFKMLHLPTHRPLGHVKLM